MNVRNLRTEPEVAENAHRVPDRGNAHGASFRARVLSAVRRVPPGRVATYGDIAELAGSPRAWRAVGSIMRECRDPGVPCHRIIAAGGGLGGYGSNLQVKRELLRAEGLEVGMTRVRRFADVRWPQTTKVAKAKVTKAFSNREPRGSRGRRKAPTRGPTA